MKTRLELVQEYIVSEIRRVGVCSIDDEKIAESWRIADAMLSENEKREQEEGKKKRAEMRELLNANNTFVEKEGQHFDDVEWQPDWSVAPDGYDWFCVGSETNNGYFCNIEPKTFKDKYWFVGEDSVEIINHSYTGDWRDSLRKRPV